LYNDFFGCIKVIEINTWPAPASFSILALSPIAEPIPKTGLSAARYSKILPGILPAHPEHH
jgi:hypothetical protein